MTRRREIIIDGDIARIPLTMGYIAVIDAADVPLVEGRNWCADRRIKQVYATGTILQGGRYRSVRLHRFLLGLGGDQTVMVDHRDGDGLNNRRANLRVCTNSENGMNRGAQQNSASGIKGVWWDSKRGKWIAEVHVAGVRKFCSSFETLEAASSAYAEAAAQFHGQFARAS
jgi:hypothetical protein